MTVAIVVYKGLIPVVGRILTDLTEKTLKRSILALKEKGILYSTPDFSEIVSVIYIKL